MADYDREECSNFIRQVRRKAFEAGKSRDKEWMADYAVSCFADDALKWSVEVPSDVLENWDVLQRALMEEYFKHRISSTGLSGAAAPTPAAAPAPSPGITLPTSASNMTGYIRIVAENSEAGNYISKTADSRFGVLYTALIRPVAPVETVQQDFPEPYCWLGIGQDQDRIGPKSYGNLCPTSAPAFAMGTSAKNIKGPTRSNIWLYHTLDSCIINVWTSDDNGEECSNFIGQVRRKAFEAGKSRDKDWMADYAVSCFAEDALKWSVGVPSNVLEDWDILQRALMEEYCKYRIPSTGAAATTPAAAPAPSPGIALPTNASTMTGYIRIVANIPGAGDYVSKTVDDEFGVLVTSSATSAQRLRQPLLWGHRPRISWDQREATFGFSRH
ncbi:hypothetical protein FRC04_007292 [Tulasnella sp. 424]|nr:hypothetical protein FRC04_007292 [Tulasnella sp. 424]